MSHLLKTIKSHFTSNHSKSNQGTNNPMVRDSHKPAIGALVGFTILGVISLNLLNLYLPNAYLSSFNFGLLNSASAASYEYSIKYNDNVVDNMPMDVNDGRAVGGNLSLASNTPTRSGYKFLGWCNTLPTTADGTDSCSGTTYQPNAGITIASATNFHLYTMWKEVQTIQGFASKGTCSTMSVGNTASVVDIRDNEEYLVGKLADNNCWMLDNLRLDITNSTILNSLTTSNTHVDANSLVSLKSGNRSAGAQYASSGFAIWNSSSTFNVYSQAKANAGWKNSTTTKYGSGSGKIGVYYNYCAASAGSYCYDDDTSTGNAPYDLCPAGWRMPTGGSSGEYQALYTAYSSNATNFKTALSTPLSGVFHSGSPSGQRSDGYFWSSTYYDGDSQSMYSLTVRSSVLYPTGGGTRYSGYSMRCITK